MNKWIVIVISVYLYASPFAKGQAPNNTLIEEELVFLHNQQINSQESYQNAIKFPKSPDYYFAWAGLVVAVGEDAALTLTLGKSEAIVKIIDTSITAIDATGFRFKVANGKKAEAIVELAATEIIEQGAKSVVKKKLKVPLVRSGVAVYGVVRAGHEEAERVFQAISEQREIIKFATETAPNVIRINKLISELESADKKKEYQEMLSSILQRKAWISAYRQMQVDRNEAGVLGLEFEVLSQINASMAAELADGKLTLNLLLSDAARDYVAGTINREQLVAQTKGYMLGTGLEPVQYTEAMTEPRMKALGAKFRELDDIRSEINKYGGGTDATAGDSIADYVQLESIVPEGYRMIANLDLDELAKKIPDNFVSSVPNQGTIVPELAEVFTVVLVLDRSGSMKSEGKIAQMKQAVHSQLRAAGNNMQVQVVVFNDNAERLQGEIGAQVDTLQASGGTEIFKGLELAYQGLKSAGEGQLVALLMTDGQNGSKVGSSVLNSFKADGIPIYTVPFGKDADIDLMQRIADETGGQLLSSSESALNLSFRQILGAIKNSLEIGSFKDVILPGQQIVRRILVPVGIQQLFIHESWEGSWIDVVVEGPDGTIISSDNSAGVRGISFVEDKKNHQVEVRINNPKAGIWNITCKGTDIPSGGEVATLSILADAGGKEILRPRVSNAAHSPGSKARIGIVSDIAFNQVVAEIHTPAGVKNDIPLKQINAAGLPPVYQADIELPQQAGFYPVKIQGESVDGQHREIWATVQVGSRDEVVEQMGDAGRQEWLPWNHPARPKKGERWTASLGKGVFIDLMPVSSGTFMMGSKEGYADERPVHQVTLTSSFWMGKTEVTLAQFSQFLEEVGIHDFGVGLKHAPLKWDGHGYALVGVPAVDGWQRPVCDVDWYLAVRFCEWLTEKEQRDRRIPRGFSYALPTEAQWEYACRAGSLANYCYGGDEVELKRYANHNASERGRGALPVAGRMANAWGLYDMHGNVFEWCLDNCSRERRVSTDTYVNGIVDPISSLGACRILRGGSWNDGANACRSSYRLGEAPEFSADHIGFRVCLNSSFLE
jgi:formylglycine-generating enzyme required for sulfatase activity